MAHAASCFRVESFCMQAQGPARIRQYARSTLAQHTPSPLPTHHQHDSNPIATVLPPLPPISKLARLQCMDMDHCTAVLVSQRLHVYCGPGT
jgi:hypothetical protein